MTTRTDIHRPVEMNPEHYSYLTVIDNAPDFGPGWVLRLGDWGLELSHKVNSGPTGERGVHQCHHCGARIRYACLLEHTPTGDVIAIGETCLDNRFELASKAEFDRLRKAAQLDREQQRIKTAAREFVNGLLADADTYTNRVGELLDRDDETKTFRFEDLTGELKNDWAIGTFGDIRRKIWNTYGQPTPRQLELLVKLVREGAEWNAQQAERVEQPAEVRADAPEGRVTFQGEVVFRKGYESDFGYTIKIIVKVTTENGIYTVFVTEPAAIETQKGDIVQLTATLKPGRSASEAKGSRPTKASILVEAGVEADSLA